MYAVNLTYAKILHKISHHTEIVVYQYMSLILRGICNGVRIAVKRDEPPPLAKPSENLAAVPSSAKGGIYVCAILFNLQRGDALLQQYRYVIRRHITPLT